MRVSVITPTNNPVYLDELRECLMKQTHGDWEWIVLLNQGVKWEPATGYRLPATGRPPYDPPQGGDETHPTQDPRIRIVECPFVSNKVGFLKRLACMNATGEVIAEVDHDDLILPTCLEKVAKAFEDPEVGFVYSRNAKLTDRQIQYLPEYGWKADFFHYKGKRLYAPFNQPVYPGRLGHIYFAPDHIRAWRTEVYESIGGHDDSLGVCDDLDLMHRMYMVTKFAEIPEVLYLYRISGDNTYLKNGKTIKDLDLELYDRNAEGLARRWAEINNLAVIDLAQGGPPMIPPEGGMGPIEDKETGCFVAALLAMTDSSVGLVVAKDCLQYFEDPRGLMEEIHRVLAPGGMLISETPSTDGRGAWQDPDVKSFWNENSFLYYTKEEWARKRRPAPDSYRDGNRRPVMFRECRMKTVYRDEFGKEHRMPYVVAHLEKIQA
jgi:SAM-dependent methyltransferase